MGNHTGKGKGHIFGLPDGQPGELFLQGEMRNGEGLLAVEERQGGKVKEGYDCQRTFHGDTPLLVRLALSEDG